MFSTFHQRSLGFRSQTGPKFKDTLRGLFHSSDHDQPTNLDPKHLYNMNNQSDTRYDMLKATAFHKAERVDTLSQDTLVGSDSDGDPEPMSSAALTSDPFDFTAIKSFEPFTNVYDDTNTSPAFKDNVKEKHFDTIDLRQGPQVPPEQQLQLQQPQPQLLAHTQSYRNTSPSDDWLSSSDQNPLFDMEWSNVQSGSYSNTSPDMMSVADTSTRLELDNFLDSMVNTSAKPVSSTVESVASFRAVSSQSQQQQNQQPSHNEDLDLDLLGRQVSLADLVNPLDIVLNPYESLKICEEIDSFYHGIKNRIFRVTSVEFQRKFRVMEIKLHTVIKNLTLDPIDFDMSWRDYTRRLMMLINHTDSWFWTENLILPLLYVASCKCPDKHTRANCIQAFRDMCLITRDLLNRPDSFHMKSIFLGSFWDGLVVALLINHDPTNTLAFETLKTVVIKFGADKLVYDKVFSMRDIFGHNFDLFFDESRTEYRGHHYALIDTFLGQCQDSPPAANSMRLTFVNDLVTWMGKETNTNLLRFLEKTVKKHGDPIELSNLQNNLRVFSQEKQTTVIASANAAESATNTITLPVRNFSRPKRPRAMSKYNHKHHEGKHESLPPISSIRTARIELSPGKGQSRRRHLKSKLMQFSPSRGTSPLRSPGSVEPASSSSANSQLTISSSYKKRESINRPSRNETTRRSIREFYNHRIKDRLSYHDDCD